MAASLHALFAVLVFVGCAGSQPAIPTVLAVMEDETEAVDAGQVRTELAPELPVSLSHRGASAGGDAYRIVLEISGERAIGVSNDDTDWPSLGESHLMELEYLEMPIQTEGAPDNVYLVSLDALHYRLAQRNPDAKREIELGDDRMRVFSDGKESLDLRGAQPKQNLTPRKLLQRVFATVAHDGNGNPTAIVSKGEHVSRRFLSELPLNLAIGYSRISLPTEPIAPGSVWHAQRFPASRAGELGLRLDIEYSLAGFEIFDGVPCAWILLRSEVDAENVRSAAGFAFERVVAKLSGMAWVELGTSRLRRMVVEDEIRTSYSQGDEMRTQVSHGLRHATRMVIELRDRTEKQATWADGSERFGRR